MKHLQQVKLLIVEWLLELFRAFCIKLLKFKAKIEIDNYSVNNKNIDLRTAPAIIKNNIIHDQKILDMRWEICKSCEFLTEANRCTKCGCFMKSKINFTIASCPVNKWGKYKGEVSGTTVTI